MVTEVTFSLLGAWRESCRIYLQEWQAGQWAGKEGSQGWGYQIIRGSSWRLAVTLVAIMTSREKS